MSGRFSDLNPNHPGRMKLWEDNSFYIRELLEEINREVFDGRGVFTKPRYLRLDSDDRTPTLLEPYLCLESSEGSIAVCVVKTDLFRIVIARYYSGSLMGSREGDFYLDQLTNGLRNGVAYVLGYLH